MGNRPIIGLTGGIGSGKSTVAAMLADLGAIVIDADNVGHEIYLPGTEGHRRVVEAFGRDVVAADGTIDRRILGARVFADPNELKKLNALVHPLIGVEIQKRLQAAMTDGNEDAHPTAPGPEVRGVADPSDYRGAKAATPVASGPAPNRRPIVVEAAIMMEARWSFFDRIWVVVVAPETAIARVTSSRGLSRDDVERRIAAQMTNAERERIADLVIRNDGTLDALRAQVEAAWRGLF